MNLEDNFDDKNINEILRYWSPEEMNFCYKLMLQQIDDEKNTTGDGMWQQSTYKPNFEEIQDMLKQLISMEGLHQQMKKLRF